MGCGRLMGAGADAARSQLIPRDGSVLGRARSRGGSAGAHCALRGSDDGRRRGDCRPSKAILDPGDSLHKGGRGGAGVIGGRLRRTLRDLGEERAPPARLPG